MTASRAPAPGGGFGTPDDCVVALEQAGFGAIGAAPLAGIWRHPDGAALLGALQAGTARMAALIESQAAPAVSAIVADIDREAALYRDGEGLAVPLSAFVAYGRKG